MKGMSVLGKVAISENALVWAKVRKTFIRKGAKAAIHGLQKIKGEQSFNKRASSLSG